ncbi:hypothetical protein B0T26DRAFT_677896 [Lasiosphaeria miniovina]|uniref:Uncharacterized protein n=1 Tax=Lasiosphaeria miniovina TaxID=1954250 RepID=A0AA40DU83_9PEZI|nr:uncharacterized protein B0T26DRAFT_677896 [Lasiosphaeria miniovina]KAK0713587.1 hypothetical protein B0T26DRAFT_677896 [Lasiosphaeria miniovina]
MAALIGGPGFQLYNRYFSMLPPMLKMANFAKTPSVDDSRRGGYLVDNESVVRNIHLSLRTMDEDDDLNYRHVQWQRLNDRLQNLRRHLQPIYWRVLRAVVATLLEAVGDYLGINWFRPIFQPVVRAFIATLMEALWDYLVNNRRSIRRRHGG